MLIRGGGGKNRKAQFALTRQWGDKEDVDYQSSKGKLFHNKTYFQYNLLIMCKGINKK